MKTPKSHDEIRSQMLANNRTQYQAFMDKLIERGCCPECINSLLPNANKLEAFVNNPPVHTERAHIQLLSDSNNVLMYGIVINGKVNSNLPLNPVDAKKMNHKLTGINSLLREVNRLLKDVNKGYK